MTSRTLITRSLRFHWRAHLGVVLGAAVGSAALIGALIVGDSVRESLRERALERLGDASLALHSGDRFFDDSLMSDYSASNLNPFGEEHRLRSIEHTKDGKPAVVGSSSHSVFDGGTFLNLMGLASRQDGAARANQVQVYGIPGPGAFTPPAEIARDRDRLDRWQA